MENDKATVKGSCRTICGLSFLPVLIGAICVGAWRPFLLPYSFKYVKIVVSHIVNDKQRFLDNEVQFADNEWRLYQMETLYGQTWCKDKGASRSNVTWLTIMINDDFVVPSLVLGHSIRTFSCQREMVAFISEDVSEATREALRSVGWDTRLVEEMDCKWMDAKVGLKRERSFFGRFLGHGIKGTHTRLHAWNYTEFSKIIYVDADYMLMTNIDELFDIPEEFAAAPCSRPGVLDTCFNAGLTVFRPDAAYYKEIMKLWRETTLQDICPNDQQLLNDFYADISNWKTLPYAYNIRRFLFRPMKSFHFACCRPPKPWSAECRPSRKEAADFDGPILLLDDMAILFWKNFYELLKKYKLEAWWRSTKFFSPTQEFGNVRFADCLKQLGESSKTTFNLKEMITNFNRTKLNLMERFNSILFANWTSSST